MKTFCATFGHINNLLVQALVQATVSSRFLRRNKSLLLAVFLFSFSSAFADSAKLDFNGHSYQRFDTGMSWTSAKVFCETKGAHLATVTSQAEHDFIANNFAPRDLWLGASDAASEGNWAWVTGEPWAFTNWYPGEPNNFGGVENYLVTDTSVLKKWNDVPNAGDNFVPLCEWDSYGASQSAGEQFSPSANPNGTWSYGYKVTPTSPMQLFDNGSSTARGIAGMYGWNASTLASEPHVYFNRTASTIGFANTVTVPARSIQMHPGPNGVFAVVRWTAPTPGTYAIAGAFRGNDSQGGARTASIRRNGVEVFSGSVLGLGALLPFNTLNTFATGDTLDFLVDPSGPHQNDSTGLTLTISNVNALSLTADLIGNWNFNDCTANDSSGVLNSGTLVGSPICEAGASGNGIRLNSTNYAEIPDSATLRLLSAFTISAWFKADALVPNFPLRLVDKIQAGSTEGYMFPVWSTGMALSAGPVGASATVPISSGVFHHAAVTFNQGNARFFLDGQFVGTGNIGASSVSTNSLPLRIGASQGVGANPNANFSGVIDEVRIYSRTLSDAEVAALTTLPAVVNGACGTAAGVATATLPTTNLCASGTTTGAMSNPPNWTWTCVGSSTGTDASCSAPMAAQSVVSLSRLLAPSEDGALFPTKAHGDGHIGDRMGLTPNDGVLLIACSGATCPWTATTTQSWIKLKATAAQTQTGNSVTGASTGTVAASLTFAIDAWEGTEGKDLAQSALITVSDGTATPKTWRVERQPLTDWDEDGVADEWEQRGYPKSDGTRGQLIGNYLKPAEGCRDSEEESSPGVCKRTQAPYGLIVTTFPITDAEKSAAKAKRDLWIWIDEMTGLTANKQMDARVPVLAAQTFKTQGVNARWYVTRDESVSRSPYLIPTLFVGDRLRELLPLKSHNFVASGSSFRNIVYRYVAWIDDCKKENVLLGISNIVNCSLLGQDYAQSGSNLTAIYAGGSSSNSDTLTKQTGALLHELGHALGLDHGGAVFPSKALASQRMQLNEAATWTNLIPDYVFGDDQTISKTTPVKPNHISLMNYLHAYDGLPVTSSEASKYDFQSRTFDAIDESALGTFWAKPLTEAGNWVSDYGVRIKCNGKIVRLPALTSGQCEGNRNAYFSPPTPSSADLDEDGKVQTIRVVKEWSNLIFNLPRGFFESFTGLSIGQANALASNVTSASIFSEDRAASEPDKTKFVSPQDYRFALFRNSTLRRFFVQAGGTSLPVVALLENQGFKADAYSIRVTGFNGGNLPAGVTATNFSTRIDALPNEKISIAPRLSIPSTMSSGAKFNFEIYATSLFGGFSTENSIDFEISIVDSADSASLPIVLPIEHRIANDFAFIGVTNVNPDIYVESSAVVLAGFDVPLQVQVRGGEIRINEGEWTPYISTVNAGDTLRLRAVSSTVGGDTRTVEVSVGGLVRTFDVKTMLTCGLDIDGDTNISAAKDGVLLNRYLLGYRGDALVTGLNLSGSHSTAQAIMDFIGTGAKYDVFGRSAGSPLATTDGLVLTRLMLGIPDSALLSGVTVPQSASFTSASAIRTFVNTKCGTNLGSP